MNAHLLVLALSSFWGGLEPGPHAVGLEMMPIRDYSRPFRRDGDDRARLLPLAIWYPAQVPVDTPPMRFGRYVGSSGREELARRLRATESRLSDDELSRIVDTETAAFEGATRAPGTFPLLLFGTGLTAPNYLNTVLCEYLASYGYVVVAVPSMPYREDVSPDFDALTIETHLRDLELVIHELRDYPGVDIETLGLVAWGSGGVAQVLLQMKNPDVVAIASLDAASGYAYGRELLGESLYFDPMRATAAFFHATDSREQTSQVEKSFDYYDNVHRGPAYLLMMEDAHHAEFTSLASMIPFESPDDVRRRYRLLCEYVRRFLDLTMKSDEDAADFLEVTPSRHGFDGLVLAKRPGPTSSSR